MEGLESLPSWFMKEGPAWATLLYALYRHFNIADTAMASLSETQEKVADEITAIRKKLDESLNSPVG